MHLIELLLPVSADRRRPFPPETFDRVRAELTEAFGGVTAFLRAPAEGFWKESDHAPVERDDVVVFEVMVEALDRGWWAVYREDLARRFRQEEIVIRAIAIERL